MIRAMEEHLLAWMKGQLDSLKDQCGLYGPVRTFAGAADLPGEAALGAGEVGLALRAEGLTPLRENRDLGPAPVTQGASLQMDVRMKLRVVGEENVLGAAAGREVAPSEAHLHRVDLAAMTLLSLLRERPGPAPDIGAMPALVDAQGRRPAGGTSAAQGTRKAQLSWISVEPGEAAIEPTNGQGLRQWDIPLAAVCTFRLSPAALNGGRVLQIEHQLDADNVPVHTTTYALAESLPLDYFADLSGPAVAELGEYGLLALGDLERLGSARMAEIAAKLRTAGEAERIRLVQLTDMAIFRRRAASIMMPYRLDPELSALPAKALLTPEAAEQALLNEALRSQSLSERIAMLALPVAALLKPERRETVPFGVIMTA
ncbi:hypothetical protein E5161_07145 [Cohnella pontilimi]|uniref:Uncharacterized protein n=1 Tax=Cohnella pontilimi TaxID=2564100 RepID=A0A4U0FD01_9BACL|nr:hypothetical protein [Cohnella pontilimi]TJY42621.1 hypothetical protein E5161_07145 [Cohnella pontilimi]